MGCQSFCSLSIVAIIIVGLHARVSAQAPVKIPVAASSAFDYSAIDRYALAAPLSVQQSIASLAVYLARKAINDREKARAIFTWVANNISYDFDGVQTGTWEQRPEFVLQLRCTDCLGRARLFEKLCLAAGMEAVVIGGRVKSIELSPMHDMRYTIVTPEGTVYDSHSWNAIKIDGKWQLVDVTAAGGKAKKLGMIEKGKPVDPYFFLIPAPVMIYTHLPNEEKWQLLEPPLSKQEQERLPLLYEGFFKYEIKTAKAEEKVLHITDELTHSLIAPVGVAMCAELRQDGHKVEGQYVFSQRGAKNYEFYAITPRPGTYILRLLGRPANSQQLLWECIADYKVDAKSGKADGSFPFAWDEFQLKQGYVFSPSSGTLNTDRPQFFKVYMPNALSVGIQTGGQIIALDHR